MKRRRHASGPRAAPSCEEKAFDLLSRRPHFEAELRSKLLKRRFDAEEVESVLASLRQRGLLDDRHLAADFVERRREERPMGRRRLLAELTRKGVEPGLAEEVLSRISDDEDEAAARRAATLWLRRGGGDRAGLARHLERRGFGARVILALLDEAGDGTNPAGCDDRVASPDLPSDS